MEAKESRYIIVFSIIGCILMGWVDAVIAPNYMIKSWIKILLFLSIPFGYIIINKKYSFKSILKADRKGLIYSFILGISVYLFILASYFITNSYFDFSKITGQLSRNMAVNKENFLFVAIYISFINSFLEEFFFRGFVFLTLRNTKGRIFAYIFSSGIFALYHISMMIGWFEPILLVLLILGLFVAGLIFNCIDEKNGNIQPSWLVHICANFAVNTIGFFLFGII